MDKLAAYAKAGVDSKGGFRGTTTRIDGYTSEQIKGLLQNPSSQYIQISGLMEALYLRNGIVNRTLNYFSTLPTYNYNIYQSLHGKGNYQPFTDPNEYFMAAEYIEKYNIKFFAPYFVLRTLIQGMSFYYEVSDNNGVSYFEFPIDAGKISGIENGVYRWMLDTSKIKKEALELDGFPNEIKKAMESGDKSDPKKWVDGKYFKLSNKAFAMCFDPTVIKNGGVAIPEFASLLVESAQVEKAKGNVDIKDDIDTVRVLHGKIPMDSEGNVKMNPKSVNMWREVLDQSLPPGIQGIVTPFDLDNVSLNNSGNNKAYDTVEDSQSQLFFAAGTPSPMFGGNTNSYNIASMSVAKDSAIVYSKILPVLTNYYNEVFSKLKTPSGSLWKIKIFNQSIFTLDEDIKRYQASMTGGGLRLDYLALLGMSPIEAYSKMHMEQRILNIDDLMVPKAMSFTMSGDGESEAGRPKTDEPSDDTDRIEN